jgi:Flp pilus assembly secretin CpaC
VSLDEARTISFDRPISTVYVGNPAIADVTMIDSTHAFILGKAFGATNLLALDGRGNQISNQPVAVVGRPDSTVTLNLGTAQLTYACGSSRCETTPTPGDAKDPYDVELGQAAAHQDLGMKNAGAAH